MIHQPANQLRDRVWELIENRLFCIILRLQWNVSEYHLNEVNRINNRTKWHERHRRRRGGYCQMFNPFSTGCLSQCKCQKQPYELWHWEAERAVEGTETLKAAGGSNTRARQQTASISRKHPRNSSKETKRLNRAKGQESRITQNDDRRFFFISITKTSQWTKLMVYIFIFIYLKCNMVQKYRRSAAPRYIYKINTPFRQNKLPQKKSDIIGIKKKKARIHKD